MARLQNTMALVLGLVSLSGLGACGNKKGGSSSASSTGSEPAKKSRPPAKPLDVKWDMGTPGSSPKGTVSGGKETIEVLGMKTSYHITLHDFSAGDDWKVADKSGSITSGPITLVDVEMNEKIANTPIANLKEVDPDLKLHLELADGRTGDVPLPKVYFDYGLRELFKGAANGKVTLGKEPDDPNKKDCIAYDEGLELKTFGKCDKVFNIDWIAIKKKGDEKGSKTCSGYKKDDGTPGHDLTLVLREWTVLLIDRRTGDVVDKKTFPPDPECPMFTYRAAGEDSKDSDISDEPVEDWIRTKIGR